LAAFYVTSPLSKVIGFGKVTEKFVDEKLIWLDEQLFQIPIWRYRIRFDKLTLIDNWEDGISIPNYVILNTGRKLIDETMFSLLVKHANQKWKKRL
jgi:hypothetical protein